MSIACFRQLAVSYSSVAELPEHAARVLSLLAHLRTSRSAEQAFEAGRAALRGMSLKRLPASELSFEALGEVVPLLHRPRARHQHVHGHERAAPGLSRAERVKPEALLPVGLEERLDLRDHVFR